MSEKVYKKRVIQKDSDEDSDEDVPLAKKPKPSSPTLAAAVVVPPVITSTDTSVPMVVDPPAKVEPESPEKETEEAKKKQLDIYETGGTDDEMNGNGNGKEESDDEDVPLSKSKAKAKPPSKGKAKPAPALKKEKSKKKAATPSEESSLSASESEEDDDDDSEDDKPLKKKVPVKKSNGNGNGNAKASSSKPASKSKKPPALFDEESSEEEKPLAKSSKKAVVKKKEKKEESATPVKGKGKKVKKEDTEKGSEDEEEVYKWWEQEDDGVTKWKTLEHAGVLFPPEYEAHGVKMNYDGKPVDLPPEAEEVASFFAAILETDYPKNPTFVKNFFDSFQGVLKSNPPLNNIKIKSFASCDFRPIWSYLETEKLKKKEMTTAQKKAAKAERDIVEEKFKTCLLDGRKEKVGNFRVEPPGLFRGRGEHPKTGLLKTRVRPEQITLNIGKEATVPAPPPGHKWKDVVHDDKVTWLATWKENINGAVKYVFLAAGSSLKGQSDFKKFEKARTLKEHVDRIRRDYTSDLTHKEMATRQRATAIYLIDRFALRNGNEKGEDEADTVGCCSLRYEHVTLEPPNKVTFDFLGKDSIRYTNTVEVDEKVFKNLKIFKKDPKAVGDLLFDRLTTGIVNKYLTSYMDGLTAKVFRTYNASWTFVQQLKDTPKDGSVADKILAYNRANRLVAVLCNHQRSVSKGHGLVMEKMTDKIRALKYQRRKLRYALLAAGDKKKYKEFKEDESDIDDDWIEKHEVNLVVQEKEKIRKKFDKDNKKLEEEGGKPLKEEELKDRLKAADDLEKTLKSERKKGWTETKMTEEKLVTAIRKKDEQIQVAKTAAVDRDEGKEISLGTSKINYLDPRITFQWAAEHNVPINKLLSKTLVEKFTWAASADADFEW